MQACLCRFDGYIAHYMKCLYVVLGCAIAVWQNTCMLAVLLFKWAYIWVPDKLILTIPRLIHLKLSQSCSTFSYTSHKPCSVLLLLSVIPVKKEKNLRWLKVQEKSKFRVTIFVLNQIRWTRIPFFLTSGCIVLWSTWGCESFLSMCLSHQRCFCEVSLGSPSEAVATQIPNPWGNFSIFLCCAVNAQCKMWACNTALPDSSMEIVGAKSNTVKQRICLC